MVCIMAESKNWYFLNFIILLKRNSRNFYQTFISLPGSQVIYVVISNSFLLKRQKEREIETEQEDEEEKCLARERGREREKEREMQKE